MNSISSITKFLILIFRISILFIVPLTSFADLTYGVIYNSNIRSNQKIALGLNNTGNLNVFSLNSNERTINGTQGSLGIAYKMAYTKAASFNLVYDTTQTNTSQSTPRSTLWNDSLDPDRAWVDATSPKSPCEAWGVSATPPSGIAKSGYVGGSDTNCAGGVRTTVGRNTTTNYKPNITVKNFVADGTSLISTVWISDPSNNQPLLEVTHRFGPSQNAPDELFEGTVTISNISGDTLKDIRYRRTMDWDPPPKDIGESYSIVTHGGVKQSFNLTTYPRVLSAGDNGWGSGDPLATDYETNSAFSNQDFDRSKFGPNAQITSQTSRGSSFIFGFGDLACGESVSFLIYYGASDILGSKSPPAGILGALSKVGAEVYAIGESNTTTTTTTTTIRNGRTQTQTTTSNNYGASDAQISPAYTFGFKGVSGTAVAPNIPPKSAILPAGITTDPTFIQTYAPVLVAGSRLYQATFKYRKEHQWPGDITRYNLDSNGNILANTSVSAASKLLVRNVGQSRAKGGRDIWTVGYDPLCDSSSVSLTPNDTNNFNLDTTANVTKLGALIFNCPPQSKLIALDADIRNLISFVRGQDSYLEDTNSESSIRSSVLADTFHSEMVIVGIPNAAYTTDPVLEKTEAYFRGNNGYLKFINDNSLRRKQIYVGANDGMLHAFDEDLNEQWAFIPPSVLSHLREMIGSKGTVNSPIKGTSNTVFNVDGPIVTKDLLINGEWKTVLMGGLGYGGKSYYALDITNPDSPKHLFTIQNDDTNKVVNYWEESGKKNSYSYASVPSGIDFTKLGDAWSRPVLMLLPYIEGSVKQKWVAVFGGGYAGGASNTSGSQVFILDMNANGRILSNIAVTADPAVTNNIVNGVPSHLTVVTSDGTTLANYYGGIGYFTDLQGQLWKLNLSKKSLTDSNNLGLSKMFLAESSQSNDRYGFNMLGTTALEGASAGTYKLFNYFGTGDITHIQRRNSLINNRVYGIEDPDFPEVKQQLQTIPTISNSPSSFTDISKSPCSVQNSWFGNVCDVTKSTCGQDSQKIVGRAAIYNKNIYFSAYKPGLICGTGTSTLLEIANGCIATLMAAPVSGLATAPTVDNKGNIYVGLGNVAANSSGEGSGGIPSIYKKKSNASISGSQMQYRSWREKRN